jgi:hypothetical protein
MMFARVNPAELPDAFVSLLEESNKYDYGDSFTLEEMARLVLAGDAQLWLFHDEQDNSHGIIITQLISKNTSRELFIWRLIGVGLKKNYNVIAAELEEFAAKEHCTAMSTIIRPDLMDVLRSCDDAFMVTGIQMRKELINGTA